MQQDPAFAKEVEKVFEQIIEAKIPVAECVSFCFQLDNVSISWREQAVRHRIGTKFGPGIGVDIIPDLADSTWWSQTMRVMNMGDFARTSRFRIPETFRDKVVVSDIEQRSAGITNAMTASTLLEKTMCVIEDAYNAFIKAGIPVEDAREVIPLGAHHTIIWSLNLAALFHIIGKRGCWIPQLGVWGPVIRGMVEELATKVHPILRRIISPPCISQERFTGCLFGIENNRRVDGRDVIFPPCPLWIHHHAKDVLPAIHNATMVERVTLPLQKTDGAMELLDNMLGELSDFTKGERMHTPAPKEAELREALSFINWDLYDKMSIDYSALWGRDPRTGKLLEKSTTPALQTT